MKRRFTAELNEWFESGADAPLLVLGPRGCGKTYSVCEFAESLPVRSVYSNFETDASATAFFEKGGFSSLGEAVLSYLGIGDNAVTEEIMMIFDEIQSCDAFCELLKGSYSPFGIKLCIISSFAPQSLISAIKCVHVSPMGFDEFLEGTGREWYSELIRGHFEKKRPVPQMLHNELLEMWEDYLHTGGMPEVVTEYAADNDSVNISERQRRCMLAVMDDIGRYGDSKMRDIIEAVPDHMAIGRRRFTFNLIRRGVTNAMYRDAIEVLVSNRIVFRTRRLEHEDSFGLTLFDCGLAGCMVRKTHEIAVERLDQQLLGTVLTSILGEDRELLYYENESGPKADLLYRSYRSYVPVFWGIGKGRSTKSISKIAEVLDIAYIVSVGSDNYKLENLISKIPVYAAFLLR